MSTWTYSDVLQKSWDAIKGNLGFTAALSLVFMLGMAVFARVPVLGALAVVPLTAGYIRCLMQIRRGEVINYKDFFWGFLDFNRLLQLVLLNIITYVGMVLGLILLVIPGVWWIVATCLASTDLVIHGGDAVASIKKSIAIVKLDWFKFLGFLLVVALFNIAGALCFFIGILVTVPVTALAYVIILESSANASRPLTDK